MRNMKLIIGILLLGFPSLPAAQNQQPDYSMLDGRSYNPKTDPDIDLFIGHWKDNPPRHIWGSLIERDILTKSAGNPLKPHTKGAVLTYINRLTYGLLDRGNATAPSRLKGEQAVLYFDKGEGILSTNGKTVKLYSGITVLLPPEIEFTMRNTGNEPLTMFIMVEPAPAGFTPRKDIVVKDENTMPVDGANIHWSHIPKFFFGKQDGLAVIDGMAPVWYDPITMGQPHSHNPGFEEIWFSVDGDPVILLGKELRPFPAGAAYKIPPDYITPHSTINVKGKPAKVFWFIVRTVPEPPPPSYSMLYDWPRDLSNDPDINMFIGNWRESMPKNTHGSLVERDILTRGDPLNPPRKGAVLKYVNRFTRAALYKGCSTAPVTLNGQQEVFYMLSGKGAITAGRKTAELQPGVAVLMPAGLEFTMKNTGEGPLVMYLISEPIPAGFRPNKDMLVVDERAQPVSLSDAHWIGIVKQLFTTADGLGTMESILTCGFSPNTFFHPHSHVEGTEEVWCGMHDTSWRLLGREIFPQPDGEAYLIPPTGKCPHANFNLSDAYVRLFYFARYQDHEVRK